MTPRATAFSFKWGETPASPKRPGMRIQRGTHTVFVPDDELLNLANQIADYLAGHRHPTRTETRA